MVGRANRVESYGREDRTADSEEVARCPQEGAVVNFARYCFLGDSCGWAWSFGFDLGDGVRRLNATLDETFLLAPSLRDEALPAICSRSLTLVFYASIGVLAATALAAIAAHLAQIGFLFSAAKLTRGFKSLDAIANARNLFSKKNLFSFFMNIAKTCVVLAIFWHVFVVRLDDFLTSAELWFALCFGGGGADFALCRGFGVVAFVPLAALDYLFQRRFHLHDLMMTKDEIKQEYKESEGSPEIKGQRRQIHREVLERPRAGANRKGESGGA